MRIWPFSGPSELEQRAPGHRTVEQKPQVHDVTDEELRAEVGNIIRGIISYDHEVPAIDRLMLLVAGHHCASCDMHSCGDLEQPALSLATLIWPIERFNPQTGEAWISQERGVASE